MGLTRTNREATIIEKRKRPACGCVACKLWMHTKNSKPYIYPFQIYTYACISYYKHYKHLIFALDYLCLFSHLERRIGVGAKTRTLKRQTSRPFDKKKI